MIRQKLVTFIANYLRINNEKVNQYFNRYSYIT